MTEHTRCQLQLLNCGAPGRASPGAGRDASACPVRLPVQLVHRLFLLMPAGNTSAQGKGPGELGTTVKSHAAAAFFLARRV